MDRMKPERTQKSAFLLAILFALVACASAIGTAFISTSQTEQIAADAAPGAIMARAEEAAASVEYAVNEQFVIMEHIASRITAQTSRPGEIAVLSEAAREQKLLHMALLDAQGEGVLDDGTSISLGSSLVLQNAINSPGLRAIDYVELPQVGPSPVLVSAVSFLGSNGGVQVLASLQAQGESNFAMPVNESAVGQVLATQRGDVIYQYGTEYLPLMDNVLDVLTKPEVDGTPANALVSAFEDGERGMAWSQVGDAFLYLYHVPIGGTNWMLVTALENTMAGVGADAFMDATRSAAQLVALIGCGACVLALIIVLIVRRMAMAKRNHTKADAFQRPANARTVVEADAELLQVDEQEALHHFERMHGDDPEDDMDEDRDELHKEEQEYADLA